jgi:DNA repair protein RecN (Recombination protein N)
MLKELHIKDFAIIDDLHLTLERGLNILTGETGAGKSILIDAVALLLGSRADTSQIRTGTERARIEGMFLLSPGLQASLAPMLEREGLEGDVVDTLWLSRELRSTGRSVARVNGRVASVSVMREVAQGLVDIHGQGEHLSLLRVREHLNLLDDFAGTIQIRNEVRAVVNEIQRVRAELRDLLDNERARMQRIDLLRFQVREIRAAELSSGEMEDLEAELVRLNHAEELMSMTAGLIERLDEGEDRMPGILDLLGLCQRDLAGLARIDATQEGALTELEDAIYRLEDVARKLRDYQEEIEFEPRRLAQVQGRLRDLRRLERKYGGSAEDILRYAAEAEAELHSLEHSDERIADLQAREQELLAVCSTRCLDLSEKRQAAAAELAARVEAELQDLRMTGAQFGIAFEWAPDPEGLALDAQRPSRMAVTREGSEVVVEDPVSQVAFDASGMDRVEFLVAPNVGEGLQSMTRTASGGETSRLMLALKTVLSREDRTPTLIFDEIDQGIGGRIGAIVGTKLWRLTAIPGIDDFCHQVMCITHLPQLAGFGDAHFRVMKQVVSGRTVTQVKQIEGDARVWELAQMLGTHGTAAEEGALEILEQSEQLKRVPAG